MSIIASISGIRGTIGGAVGDALTPLDLVKYTAAYGTLLAQQHPHNRRVVLGRDARISGSMVRHLVVGTLQSVGISVIDLGLATTPTVEMAVTSEAAAGGIILSASHNPRQWNALKLLNEHGEFISDADGKAVLHIADMQQFVFVAVDDLGGYSTPTHYLHYHIEQILALPLVDKTAITQRGFRVVVDGINSVGGVAIPALLRALGVSDIVELHCEPTGDFAHNPEPLPEHLTDIAQCVLQQQADLGIVVDPDADRLAFVQADGTMFGEEYTLVAVADYILQHHPGGATVSNLSSTRSLAELTQRYGGTYQAAAVGEVNVVASMKATNAVIGGEGNGGIIYPPLHYGRDALVGVALLLSYLARRGGTINELRQLYPNYYMYKGKINLPPHTHIDTLLQQLQQHYQHQPTNTIDGLKITFGNDWAHLRKSNTEPIVRLYIESDTPASAQALADSIEQVIKKYS